MLCPLVIRLERPAAHRPARQRRKTRSAASAASGLHVGHASAHRAAEVSFASFACSRIHPQVKIGRQLSCRSLLKFRGPDQRRHAEKPPQHVAELEVLADEALVALIGLADGFLALLVGEAALAEHLVDQEPDAAGVLADDEHAARFGKDAALTFDEITKVDDRYEIAAHVRDAEEPAA